MKPEITVIRGSNISELAAGVKWLKKNAGIGGMWRVVPGYPHKSKKQWWAQIYPTCYIIWIKDPHVALLYRLSVNHEQLTSQV